MGFLLTIFYPVVCVCVGISAHMRSREKNYKMYKQLFNAKNIQEFSAVHFVPVLEVLCVQQDAGMYCHCMS